MQQLWITCVHHHPHGPIAFVNAFVYDPSTNTFTTPQPATYARELVMQWINNGNVVVTTTTNPAAPTVHNPGARVVLTHDRRYITSVGNNISQDNLGNLRRCT